MKKQKMQFLILLAVCLVCIGGYFLIKNKKFEKTEEETAVTVTDFNKDDVVNLDLTGDHEFHFVKEDDTWTETSMEGVSIDQAKVNSLVSLISDITTEETVVESPSDLAQYGLDEPYRTISATLSDGTTVTIYVGTESNLLTKYYVQVEGSDDVYLIDPYIISSYNTPLEEIAEQETETAETETDSEAGNETDIETDAETETDIETNAETETVIEADTETASETKSDAE